MLGQDLPPGPTTVAPLARIPLNRSPVQFEETQSLVLDFAPGAWTPLHSHGGLTLVAVIEGEMTVRSGGRETVYRAGDVWIEQPDDVHEAGNVTGTDARVGVAFLPRHSAPVTTVATAQASAPAPRALPRTREPGGIVQLLLGLGIALTGAGYAVRRARRA